MQILILCFGKDALELDAGTSLTTVVRRCRPYVAVFEPFYLPSDRARCRWRIHGEVSQNGLVLAFGLIHTGLVCHRKMPCKAAIPHLALCKCFIFIFKKGLRRGHVPDCFCSSPGFNRACCSAVFYTVKIGDIGCAIG